MQSFAQLCNLKICQIFVELCEIRLQDPIESQPPRVGDLAPNEEPFSGLFIEQKTTRGERGSKMISKMISTISQDVVIWLCLKTFEILNNTVT